MEKTANELDAEIKRIELETAQIRLEQAREENATYKAQKAAKLRANEANLAQLRTDLAEKRRRIKHCTHRQGGSPGHETEGEGKSALRTVVLPDERTLVMCANCPMRVFSPLPTDKNPERRAGETAQQAKARVERYQEDLAEFERLLVHSRDQLTTEAAQPMHCGKTFSFENRAGNRVTMPAPCDSYAAGRDNRRVA